MKNAFIIINIIDEREKDMISNNKFIYFLSFKSNINFGLDCPVQQILSCFSLLYSLPFVSQMLLVFEKTNKNKLSTIKPRVKMLQPSRKTN